MSNRDDLAFQAPDAKTSRHSAAGQYHIAEYRRGSLLPVCNRSEMIPPSQRMAAVQQPIIPVVGDLILANPGTISLGQGIVHYPPPPDVEPLSPDLRNAKTTMETFLQCRNFCNAEQLHCIFLWSINL